MTQTFLLIGGGPVGLTLAVAPWRLGTGAELAECLEVDVHTVQRYIARLRELNIPVEASPGWAVRTGCWQAFGYRLFCLQMKKRSRSHSVCGRCADWAGSIRALNRPTKIPNRYAFERRVLRAGNGRMPPRTTDSP